MDVLVGIGRPGAGDDAAGVALARLLRRRKPAGWTVFAAEANPENFVGAIARLAPRKVVLVDACEMGCAPGTVKELRADGTTGGAFGTHAPDMGMFEAFLADCVPGTKMRLVGIQPETLAPGPMSRPVRDAVRRLAACAAGG
ncbi:MAG: hydrogenase maturation protease [Kiritimatiellae bacterium]|nr:hydrogenase maturation protease [Kiritimatiellia bacterium]